MAGVTLSLVAAVAENGVIGSHGAMPWKLSTDVRRFKALTMGKPVIMGRKTFEAIGKALAGRVNIVVSRDRKFAREGVIVVPSIEAAIVAGEEQARRAGDEEVMVIGGGEIYRATLALADRLYITHVEARPDGDVTFPAIDPAVWRARSAERFPAGQKDSAATTFVVYDRTAPSAAG
ncbi:MAG TPA: dihydrofolate reductase [Bauldia sp.]|nr:dihydrofolate reductase [Bauldia sp.]